MQIQDILTLAQENKASDIHISPGNPVMLRIDGDLEPCGEQKLMPNDIDELLRPLMSNKELNHLEEVGELDFAFSVPGFSRIRANVFRQRGTFAAALRILSYDVPSAETLGIPKSVIELTEKKRGLVLVTGATGSGKSTTLASLIEIIANRDRKNIITLEDPIEYLHTNKKAIVCQREIGCDTLSYTNALRAALRQDPDVILLGEMRDADTITTAITAAETGHLVFSTLHTNNSSDAIDRILGSVDPEKQQQIRLQFSSVLEGVVAQQLMPRCDREGRVAAFEVLLATSAVRNLIRESKTMQIPSIIQTSKKEGMQTMDDCILSLYFQSIISEKTAIEYAFDEDYIKSKIF